jgi:hypothetical protein
MTGPTIDPMAGERARAIRANPEASQPIPDPTDPRCRKAFDSVPTTGDSDRILDPTDPEYGQLPA